MPFGPFNAQHRLGIANVSQPRAIEFVTNVLKLSDQSPIYQQVMVRNGAFTQGPARTSAEWGCGGSNSAADNDIGKSAILRQISAHEFYFSRRNINDSPNFNFNTYINQYTDQVFYVCNEPEAFASLSAQGLGGRCTCYEPPEWRVDNDIAACFPTGAPFWENAPDEDGIRTECASGTDWRRVRADALAKVFLRLKRRANNTGRGHVVLPPSSLKAILGAKPLNYDPNDPNRDRYPEYWDRFYDSVHNGIGGSCAEAALTTPELTALHTHQYTFYSPDNPPTDPIATVAALAIGIRRGCDWYRDRYYSGNSLPLDYVLSESGPDWRIVADYDNVKGDPHPQRKHAWTGGFDDFLKGLNYWNTWLAWVTRRAPFELNLQGWDTGNHTVYACIHTPDKAPYALKNASARGGSRNQWYFNLDAWDTYVYYDAPMYETDLNDADGQYKRSFSFFSPTTWWDSTWHLGPFGACYAVWATVANDPNTAQFGTGFFLDNGQQRGSIGSVNVSVPKGWSTIYIPFIKSTGAFYNVSLATSYNVRWHDPENEGSYRDHGWIDFSLFQDTSLVQEEPTETEYEPYEQMVYSSMVLPLLVKSSKSRTFKLELTRNQAGPAIFIGRPVVLEGVACTWSVFH